LAKKGNVLSGLEKKGWTRKELSRGYSEKKREIDCGFLFVSVKQKAPWRLSQWARNEEIRGRRAKKGRLRNLKNDIHEQEELESLFA